MRLIESVIEANHRFAAAGGKVELPAGEFADAFPLVALSCIDARLNRLLPEKLGVLEDQFIWLRNAGNIITGPMSSTMRSLALACAVKGGREIAIIGHSDCQVAKNSTLQLLECFARMGVERSRLPDNIAEFFGVFASERQNVLKACEIVRSSPLIGKQIPVHGLLMDVRTGRLEWLVNGYESYGSTASDFASSLKSAMGKAEAVIGDFKDFQLGDIKFPEGRIGEFAAKVEQVMQKVEEVVEANPQVQSPKELAVEAARDYLRNIVKTKLYKVIGEDRKVYGPIRGDKLIEWIKEERIDAKTPVQLEGSSEWAPLEKLGELIKRAPIPIPPPLQPGTGIKFKRPGQR